MHEWWKSYFSEEIIEKVKLLLQKSGKDAPALHEELLEKAALCRLSFASLKLDQHEMRVGNGCAEAVITETHYGMKKSRPSSAKWAFWIGYFVKRELVFNGKPPSSDLLAKLISILLTRKVTQEEVRTKLSQINQDAKKHATEAGSVLFRNALKPLLSDPDFEADLKAFIEDCGFSETSRINSFIVNGKIPEERLKAIIKIRRYILLRIGLYGLLAGQEPHVKVDYSTKIIHGVPIGTFVSNSPIPQGTIHLDKASEVPYPKPVLQQNTNSIGETSLTIKKEKESVGSMTLKFPSDAIESGDPNYAAIIAEPAWWKLWQMAII